MKGLEERRGIVIYNEQWHKGIIGIVASRVTEQYYRPAVVLTRSGDMATGSARSVTGFDVYKAVQSCADLLETSADTPMPPDSRCEWRTCRNFRDVSKPTWPNTFSTNRHNPRSTSPLCSTSTRSISNSTSSCANLPLPGPATSAHSSARPASMTMATSKVVGLGQKHIRLEVGRQQIERRDERHCLRPKFAGTLHQNATRLRHLLRGGGKLPQTRRGAVANRRHSSL